MRGNPVVAIGSTGSESNVKKVSRVRKNDAAIRTWRISEIMFVPGSRNTMPPDPGATVEGKEVKNLVMTVSRPLKNCLVGAPSSVTWTNTESDASRNPMLIALAGVAKTNGTTAAAKVSAAIPARPFKGMSAMILPRRLRKTWARRCSAFPVAAGSGAA